MKGTSGLMETYATFHIINITVGREQNRRGVKECNSVSPCSNLSYSESLAICNLFCCNGLYSSWPITDACRLYDVCQSVVANYIRVGPVSSKPLDRVEQSNNLLNTEIGRHVSRMFSRLCTCVCVTGVRGEENRMLMGECITEYTLRPCVAVLFSASRSQQCIRVHPLPVDRAVVRWSSASWSTSWPQQTGRASRRWQIRLLSLLGRTCRSLSVQWVFSVGRQSDDEIAVKRFIETQAAAFAAIINDRWSRIRRRCGLYARCGITYGNVNIVRLLRLSNGNSRRHPRYSPHRFGD